jgi:uncharacterized delta-60 repeat protein
VARAHRLISSVPAKATGFYYVWGKHIRINQTVARQFPRSRDSPQIVTQSLRSLPGSTDDIAYAMALQRDGKLVVGGRTAPYPAFDFGVARYTSNGQLDQSFGNGGKVVTDLGTEELGYGIALQRDGRILLSGGCFNGSNFDMAALRYLRQ